MPATPNPFHVFAAACRMADETRTRRPDPAAFGLPAGTRPEYPPADAPPPSPADDGMHPVVAKIAGWHLVDPTDAAAHLDVAAYVNEYGTVDAAAQARLRDDLVALTTQRPHLAPAPVPVDQQVSDAAARMREAVGLPHHPAA